MLAAWGIILQQTHTGNPTFADLLAGAATRNSIDLGAFCPLRPASRNYEAGLNFSTPVNSWINLTVNLRAEQNEFDGRGGLRSGLFVLPAGHPQNPLGQSIGVARYLDGAPAAAASGLATRSRATLLRAQFHLAHAINLANELVIRDGFPIRQFVSTRIIQSSHAIRSVNHDGHQTSRPFMSLRPS